MTNTDDELWLALSDQEPTKPADAETKPSAAPISFEELLAQHSKTEDVAVTEIQKATSFAELAEQFGIDLEAPAAVPEVEQFENTVEEPIEEQAVVESEFSFEMSPNLIKEPQTNSIVLDIADPLLSGEIVTDSGEIVRTGSIELPILTNTGSIPVITSIEDRSTDNEVMADFADNYVTSIAPVRASGVMNSRARESVLPLKTRRGEGQTVLLAVTSILMVTVGALVLAAWMLGIFNRPLGTN